MYRNMNKEIVEIVETMETYYYYDNVSSEDELYSLSDGEVSHYETSGVLMVPVDSVNDFDLYFSEDAFTSINSQPPPHLSKRSNDCCASAFVNILNSMFKRGSAIF